MTSTAQAPQSGAKATHPEHLGHVVFITAAAAMGGFLFGYDSSVINGANGGIQDRFDLSSGVTGTVAASALLGSALGAAIAGRIADRIGRIRVMQIAAVLFAVSAVGSALPFAAWDLAAWRVLGGIAIGMASVIGPAYIAEVAPPAYRGRLASFQQAAIVIGIAVSQLVNWAILNMADGAERGEIAGLESWQWMLGVMVVPALVYGLLSFAIPESPRYLISAGRLDDAKKVLADVEGDIDLDARVAEIDQAMRSDHKSTFRDLSLIQIFYYSNLLWQSVGVDPSSSFFYSFETSIINLSLIHIDRLGGHGHLAGGRRLGLLLPERQRPAADRAGCRGADRRQRLRALLRPVLGCRGLGHAR